MAEEGFVINKSVASSADFIAIVIPDENTGSKNSPTTPNEQVPLLNGIIKYQTLQSSGCTEIKILLRSK